MTKLCKLAKLFSNFSIIIVISSFLMASGCTTVATFWRKNILGKPEDWQKNLVLGENRRPQNNQVTSDGNILTNTPTIDDSPLYAGPSSDKPQYYNNAEQESIDNFQYPGDVPGLVPGTNGYIAEPEKPWLKNGSVQNYNPSKNSYQDDNPSNIYNDEGIENGEFNPPSYQKIQENSTVPFQPAQYRIIRRFEPMAYEYNSTEGIQDESDTYQVDLSNDVTDSKEPSKSMFPLEEYAPKSDVSVNELFKNDSTTPNLNQETEATDIAEDMPSPPLKENTNEDISNSEGESIKSSPQEENTKNNSKTNDFVTEYAPTNSEYSPAPIVYPQTGDIIPTSELILLPDPRYLSKRNK